MNLSDKALCGIAAQPGCPTTFREQLARISSIPLLVILANFVSPVVEPAYYASPEAGTSGSFHIVNAQEP